MQNTSRIGNLEAIDDFFDGKEIDCVPIKQVEIVKLCFDHLGMFLLLGYPHCDIHAHWEMNLIQQHELNFHIYVFCSELHPFSSKRQPNFEFVLHHC